MKYVRVRILGRDGSHVQPLDRVADAIEGALGGAKPGTMALVELMAMSDEEYAKLPEFMGW